MSGGEGKVVAVTGASGYIASWVVKLLLERGYTVKASVRDPNDPKKTEHLRSLDGAQERLQLFAANLLEDGSFDAIVDGCVGVFHTASPVLLSVNDPKADLLDPAIKGTLNVLQSSAKVPTIKRVIVTSSVAAVAYSRELKTDAVVDETWFSDPSYCEERKMWYPLSKTLAENAAWRFAKEHGIDMITINPGFVIGPHLQPTLSSSVQFFLELVNGVVPYPNTTFRWVDVRDVAYAHVLAFETPSASGRYCLVGRTADALETLEILRQLYPTHKFPDEFSDNSTLIFPHHTISNEKAKGLGIEFTPLETSLRDAIECFMKKNLVSP